MGDRFDVVVAGGGYAGIAAACAAARLGAHTLLAERRETLGGNVSNAWVHTICGLYRHDLEGFHPANSGFPIRFANGLSSRGAAGAPEKVGRVRVLPIYPESVAAYCADLCTSTPGLEWTTRSSVIGAVLAQEPAQTTSLVLDEAGGTREIEASVVVDATGDGAVAAIGGADVMQEPANELQIPSLILKLDGMIPSALNGFAPLRLSASVAGAVKSKQLPPGCESVLVRPGGTPGTAFMTLNLTVAERDDYDPLDPDCLMELYASGRAQAEQIVAFLRTTRPEFEHVRIAAWPRSIGVRETRRVRGEHVMTEDDVLTGTRREDEVAVSVWPIELWRDHRRAEFHYPRGPSSVPLSALRSHSHPELGVAGRCLSASHLADAALRVLGTALATGQAVGIAAALAADQAVSLRTIAAADVRRQIESNEP